MIRDYARKSFPRARPVLDGAIDLMRRIKQDFVYKIGATDGARPRRRRSSFGAASARTSLMS